MTTLFLDNFTDTNGTVLSSHTPDTDAEGGGWLPKYRDEFEIQSNVAEHSGSAQLQASMVVDVATSDCTVAVDIVVGSGGTNAAPGFFLRTNGTDAGSNATSTVLDGYICWLNRSAGELQLLRIDNGVTTSLDSATVTISGGDAVTLTATLNGTSISVEATGDVVASVSATDGTYSGTHHGLYAVDNGPSPVSTFDAFQIDSLVSDSITLTDLTNLRVYQRDSGDEASITVAGTYAGSPDHIQYRIVDDGTDTAVIGHDWTTGDASPSGGTFSFTVSGVPAGGWYNVDVRTRDASNNVLASDGGTNKWGVGVLIGCAGQSLIAELFSVGTSLTADSRVVKYTDAGWSATIGGDGAIQLGNQLEASLDMPVGLLNYGVSGAALRSEADTGAGYWLDATANEPQDEFLDGVSAATGAANVLEAILWDQGQRDARSGVVTEAEYLGTGAESGLEDLFPVFRSNISHPSGGSVPIVLISLGRGTDPGSGDDDASFQAIRRAQMTYAASDGACYLMSNYGLALRDSVDVHLNGTSYIAEMDPAAALVMVANGDIVSVSNCPQMSSISAASGSDTITLTFDQDLDTGDTSYATEGWRVEDDGSPATISSVTRTGARTIDIVLSANVTGPTTLRVIYQYGAGSSASLITYPQSAAVALPNSAGNINLPAEPFDTTQAVTADHDLTAQDISTGAPSVESATMTQVHGLTAAEVATGAPSIEAASLSQVHDLTAGEVSTGTPAVEAASLTQIHDLTPGEVTTGAPSVEGAALTQIHDLTAAELATGAPSIEGAVLTPDVGSPDHSLTAQDVTTGAPSVAAGALSQVHGLTAGEVATAAPSVASSALSQIHSLVAGEIATGTASIEAAVLTPDVAAPDHSLTAQDITTGAPSVAGATMTQIHSLIAGAVTLGGPTIEAATISGGITVEVADLTVTVAVKTGLSVSVTAGSVAVASVG